MYPAGKKMSIRIHLFLWIFLRPFQVAYLFLNMDRRNRIQIIENRIESLVALQVQTIQLTFQNIVSGLLHLVYRDGRAYSDRTDKAYSSVLASITDFHGGKAGGLRFEFREDLSEIYLSLQKNHTC